MVSCKKLSGSASRSLCLPLLHHVRLSEKNIAISRILREVFPQPRTKPAVRPLSLTRVGDPKCFSVCVARQDAGHGLPVFMNSLHKNISMNPALLWLQFLWT